MYNTFILNYDPLMTDPTPVRLIEFIRSNGYTYQYFYPFAGTVVIKSLADLNQMTASYRPFFSPTKFLLTHVAPAHVGGLLEQERWDWINAASPPPLLTHG
ncbi:hypothetical protein [Allosphingosinicella sp.]|jgi:hypothetical protein|uniref:hypothetical protein n=1 Tax=Allosphingosinicella sp. TaxID=2823234 RepID=UPI002F026559